MTELAKRLRGFALLVAEASGSPISDIPTGSTIYCAKDLEHAVKLCEEGFALVKIL